MDVITMSSIVQHGLIQRDRVFTVSVLLPDKPGELARWLTLLAEEHGNVIKLEHNQFVSINRNAAVELRITMEAFGTDHKESDRDGAHRRAATVQSWLNSREPTAINGGLQAGFACGWGTNEL